jgi:ATPase family associated with various cellular activities (AAA)
MRLKCLFDAFRKRKALQLAGAGAEADVEAEGDVGVEDDEGAEGGAEVTAVDDVTKEAGSPGRSTAGKHSDPGRSGPGRSKPKSLPAELRYLEDLIRYRIESVLYPAAASVEPPMPSYDQWELPIGKFILNYNKANTPLTEIEAKLLLIALVDHVQPDLFDHSINGVLKGEADFPMIGGARGKNFRGFIPTGQTAIFLLDENNWHHDLSNHRLFWADQFFVKNKILWLGDVEQGEPALSGKIILSQDYVDILAYDKVVAPHHNINFPAKLISTTRDRTYLIISAQLNRDFDHVLDWIKHHKELHQKWEDGKKGYRCLFHGPSGTGKTFATCILGKETGREVYRIDLSLVVSKYIGETEKNLELVFARAENKDWILFFDEADALFGKRTNIRDAHDKYANQEASYLLQRIEEYDGLVVLATNMKSNIDDSFLRRFDSDLKFTMPNMEERRQIWQKSFPTGAHFRKEDAKKKPAAGQPQETPKRDFYPFVKRDRDERDRAKREEEKREAENIAVVEPPLDIPNMVKGYALSGAMIQNVVHYATIRAAKRQADEKAKETSAKGANDAGQPGGAADAGQQQPQGTPDAKQAKISITIYLEDIEEGVKRELSKNGIPLHPKQYQSWASQQHV